MRAQKGFTLIELLVVIIIISLLAALLLPALVKALCSARQGATQHLIDGLSQASKNYEFDQNAYPPGTGIGSIKLADALQAEGPKKLSYFAFRPTDRLGNGTGEIISPIWEVEIIKYQRNFPPKGTTEPVMNVQSFDLWTMDCTRENERGVNNW